MRLLPTMAVLALALVSACGGKNEPANGAHNGAQNGTHNGSKETAAPPPVSKNAPVETAAPMQSGQMKYATVCLGCHGQNGKGQPPFPKLAGKPAADLAAMLKDYRAGKTRGPQSATMMPFAKILTDAEIDAIAGYLAGQ